jgi:hypothetical protein
LSKNRNPPVTQLYQVRHNGPGGSNVVDRHVIHYAGSDAFT